MQQKKKNRPEHLLYNTKMQLEKTTGNYMAYYDKLTFSNDLNN